MTITVEVLYQQATTLPYEEQQRLARLLSTHLQQPTTRAEQLRRARALVVASGEPLLSWEELEHEIAERRGEGA